MNGGSRRAYRDRRLVMPELKGGRSLYLVVFDKDEPGDVLACALFRQLEPRTSRAVFATKGVGGQMLFRQNSPFEATHVSLNITGMRSHASLGPAVGS